MVRDLAIAVNSISVEKANPNNPGHVAAPFSGVVTLQVEEGAAVEAGQSVASIEAMKMEAAITATVSGRVRRVAIPKTQQVDAGDLLIEIEPA
jgi:pyruvate carboxylase